MAYNYLGLVNQINRRLNEVELTSANFATATGFYSQAKDAINSSIRYMNQSEFGWPFNHVEQEDVLTANTTRYGFPDDAKHIDFNSFRIKEDSAISAETRKIGNIAYEDYLNKYIRYEYDEDNASSAVPNYVFRSPANEYGMVPPPDKAYTLVYEYYRIPVDLESHDDVPSIPERFAHIIVDGGMYYAYLFRGNSQDSLISKEKFEEGIKNMRSLLINRYDYVRSTFIPSSVSSGRLGSATATPGAAFD
tara:strand:- start:4443 stop:5189 length:747 start_codon:yes stop_codon:yes gene_type:complete